MGKITKTKVTDDVKQIIVDMLKVDEKEVVPEATLRNNKGQTLETILQDELCPDSLDFVELVMEFEKKFNIQTTDKQMWGINTVGDAIDLIYLLANK